VAKLLCSIVVCLLFVGIGLADDILYATDGTALYTVDLITGALTFQSDGSLKWIASPAFDEEHHTRFWVGDAAGDYIYIQGTGPHAIMYHYGNPFTGEYAGPYPALGSAPPVQYCEESHTGYTLLDFHYAYTYQPHNASTWF
jgi:hypothetical protein